MKNVLCEDAKMIIITKYATYYATNTVHSRSDIQLSMGILKTILNVKKFFMRMKNYKLHL
jgi:hypothetical protein